MEWDAIFKVVETGNTILILALILFGGGNGERALWVYGWIYRQARAELKAERAEKEKWQRAFLRLATSLNKALDQATMATALAELAARKGITGDVGSDE